MSCGSFVSGLYDEEIEHGFGEIFVKVDDANYATSTEVHLQHRKADNMWVLSLKALESPAVSPVGEPSGTEGSSEPAAEPTAKVATAQTVSLTVGAPKGDLCVAGAPSSPPPPTRVGTHTPVYTRSPKYTCTNTHTHTHTANSAAWVEQAPTTPRCLAVPASGPRREATTRSRGCANSPALPPCYSS